MNMHSTSQSSPRSCTPAARLARSAVCVALVAGIGWIGFIVAGPGAPADPSLDEAAAAAGFAWIGYSGAGIGVPADLAVDEAAAAAGVVSHGDRAAAHRRQVFEERRTRFEARTPTQVAGGRYPEPAVP